MIDHDTLLEKRLVKRAKNPPFHDLHSYKCFAERYTSNLEKADDFKKMRSPLSLSDYVRI